MKNSISKIEIFLDAKQATDRLKSLRQEVQELSEEIKKTKEELNGLEKKNNLTSDEESRKTKLKSELAAKTETKQLKNAEYLNAMKSANQFKASADEIRKSTLSQLQSSAKATRSILKEIWPSDVTNIRNYSNALSQIEQQTKLLSVGLTSVKSAMRNLGSLNLNQLNALKDALEIKRKTTDPKSDEYTRAINSLAKVKDRIREISPEFMNLNNTLKNLPSASIQKLQSALTVLKEKLNKTSDPQKLEQLRAAITRVDRQIKITSSDAGNINYVLKNLNTAPVDALKRAYKDLQVKIETSQRGTREYIAATKNLRAIDRQIQSSGDQWARQSSFIESAKKRLVSYVGVYLSFNALVAKTRQLITASLSLSDSIADIQKVTKMTEQQVDGLSKALDHIDTRSSQEQLHKLGYQAGLLGLSTQDDIIGFVRAADQMNWALKELGDDGAVQLMKVANLMGEVQKTGGVEEALTRVGSAINELTANSAASAGPIVNFVSRMGSVGAICHYTSADLVAIGATLDALAVPAERGGTAMNKFMSALDTNLSSIAEKLNFSSETVKNMQESGHAMEAMLFVLGKLKEQGDGGMSALGPIFKDLGGEGERLKSVIASLVQHVDMLKDYSQISDLAYEEGVSMLNEFNIKNETAAATFARLGNTLKEKFINSGFVRWLQTVGKYLIDVNKYSERHATLLNWLTVLINILIARILFLASRSLISSVTSLWQTLAFTVTNLRNRIAAVTADTTATNANTAALQRNNAEQQKQNALLQAGSKVKGMGIALFGSTLASAIALITAIYTIYQLIDRLADAKNMVDRIKDTAINEVNEEMGTQAVEAASLIGRIQDLNTELPKLQNNTKKYKEGTDEAKEASKKYNSALMEKHRLIRQANSSYSSYLGYQIGETDNNRKLAQSIRDVNRALQQKMALMIRDKMMEKSSEALVEPMADAKDKLLVRVRQMGAYISKERGSKGFYDKEYNEETLRRFVSYVTPTVNRIVAQTATGSYHPNELAAMFRNAIMSGMQQLIKEGRIKKEGETRGTLPAKTVDLVKKYNNVINGNYMDRTLGELWDAVKDVRETTKQAEALVATTTEETAKNEKTDIMSQMKRIVSSLQELVGKTKKEKNPAAKEDLQKQFQSGLGRLQELLNTYGTELAPKFKKTMQDQIKAFSKEKIMFPNLETYTPKEKPFDPNRLDEQPYEKTIAQLKSFTEAMIHYKRGNVESEDKAKSLLELKDNADMSPEAIRALYKNRIQIIYKFLQKENVNHEGKLKDKDSSDKEEKEAKKAVKEQFKVLEAILETFFSDLSKETTEAFINNNITEKQKDVRLSAISQNKSLAKANLYSVILGEKPMYKNTVDLSTIFNDVDITPLADTISKYVKSDEEFGKMRSQAEVDALNITAQNLVNMQKLLNRRDYEQQAFDKTSESVVEWGLLKDSDKEGLNRFVNMLTIIARLPKLISKEDLEKIFPKDDVLSNRDYLKSLASPETQKAIEEPDLSKLSGKDAKIRDMWDNSYGGSFFVQHGSVDNYDQQMDVLLTIIENFRNDLIEADKKKNDQNTKNANEIWKPKKDEFNQKMQEAEGKRGVMSSLKDLGIVSDETMEDYDMAILQQKIQYQYEYINALKEGGADAFDAQQKLYELQTELDQKDMERTKNKLSHYKEYTDAIVSFSESMGEAAVGEVEDRKEAAKQLLRSLGETSKKLIMIWVKEQLTKAMLDKQGTNTKAAEVGKQLLLDESQTTAEVATGIARGGAKEVGRLGVAGIALMAVISAALGAVLSYAIAKVTKAKSVANSSTGSASSNVAAGMLTYADGNYPVLGSDGVVYNARRVDRWKTGVYKGAHYGIIAEKKPELIVDGNTTQKMMTMRPDLYAQILSLATDTRPQRMKTYAEGNLPIVITQNNSVDQDTVASLQRTMAATAAVIDNLSLQLQKGISISPYGENGAVRQMQKSSAWMAKHGLI